METFELTDVQREVLILFAKYNMNRSETARKGYRHRNTLTYHFDKIEENTGLDPRCFYDLVKLLESIGELKT
jgi:carbohydrate diacid regulator